MSDRPVDPADPDEPAAGAVPPEPPPSAAPAGWGAPPPPSPQPYGAPDPAAPGAQPYAAAPRSSNDGVIALVLAILSWVFCPLVLAVIALVFAARGKREIDASNGWITGDGMVTAAKVISWINIALCLLVLVVFVVVLIVAALASTR